jgi:hypothetical protein
MRACFRTHGKHILAGCTISISWVYFLCPFEYHPPFCGPRRQTKKNKLTENQKNNEKTKKNSRKPKKPRKNQKNQKTKFLETYPGIVREPLVFWFFWFFRGFFGFPLLFLVFSRFFLVFCCVFWFSRASDDDVLRSTARGNRIARVERSARC